ncbi:MAG: hypothetical protein FJW27_08805 [Acidimicrobiia bacterium]|nr:hypothetical protein [Acidimicrobiia bacterium]
MATSWWTKPALMLKRTRTAMASMLIALIGVLFISVGAWILLLRFEDFADLVSPHSLAIGQMTVNGEESRPHAELMRARFDHHFRRPATTPRETGFVESVALDTPQLFREKEVASALDKVTLEVSGVDLTRFLQFVNLLVRPGLWTIEGDFRTQPDRALLALRLSRGPRLVRTWYLERHDSAPDKSTLLQQLLDDAIFQLVYDFGNKADTNADPKKWRGVVPLPEGFPSPAAVGAYFEPRGALARYYAQRDWDDLDLAITRLRALRAEMPTFADGLQLLGLALAERRNETEAIHVYEQLQLLFQGDGSQTLSNTRRLLSVELLKASATIRLYTWQPTHAAIASLLALFDRLGAPSSLQGSPSEQAAYAELRAQAASQLAYGYALYLSYLRDHSVAEVFGTPEAPTALRVSDSELRALSREGSPDEAKVIVLRVARAAFAEHETWQAHGRTEQAALEQQWQSFERDGSRRRAELASRLAFAAGYAHYRIAEWEPIQPGQQATPIFGRSFDERLAQAAKDLGEADARHPNHYLVLQLLGLVHSEPRRDQTFMSIAEEYFERAVQAKPSDYYGHELLAGLMFRRALRAGIDLASRPALENGLAEATKAVELREVSGPAHLLRAQFQVLLLEIERETSRRKELRDALAHSLEQAWRFLPYVFKKPDVDLTWLRLVFDVRRLGEDLQPVGAVEDRSSGRSATQRFAVRKTSLLADAEDPLAACTELERRWVNNQRLDHVKTLKRQAEHLKTALADATEDDWREIPIAFGSIQ